MNYTERESALAWKCASERGPAARHTCLQQAQTRWYAERSQKAEPLRLSLQLAFCSEGTHRLSHKNPLGETSNNHANLSGPLRTIQ